MGLAALTTWWDGFGTLVRTTCGRIKGNQPEVLAALTGGFAGEGAGEAQAVTLEKKPG